MTRFISQTINAWTYKHTNKLKAVKCCCHLHLIVSDLKTVFLWLIIFSVLDELLSMTCTMSDVNSRTMSVSTEHV